MNKQKTKLCVITPAHWKAFMGGSQYQVKCLLDELLPSDRFDVYYLANRTSTDSDQENYPVISVGGRTPRLGYLMHAVPLYRALERIRPDVIYQRVACGYTGISAYYASRHKARFIWHVAHDSDVSKRSSIHGRNPIRRFLEQQSVNYGIYNATHIVTQTEHQASLLRKNFGRKADAIVPNFHPDPSEKIDKTGQLSVLWVANLKPWKQPEAFVDLAASLSRLTNVSFTMVGALMPGPRENEWANSVLTKIANTSNLQYLGQLDQADINQLMARAHLFINTSIEEGFPNTFIQAWMRQVPVVSLHVNPDGVFDREQVGFHAGTLASLTQVVRELLTNAELRAQYALQAADYASRRHSVRNVAVLEKLFDKGSHSSINGSSASPEHTEPHSLISTSSGRCRPRND